MRKAMIHSVICLVVVLALLASHAYAQTQGKLNMGPGWRGDCGVGVFLCDSDEAADVVSGGCASPATDNAPTDCGGLQEGAACSSSGKAGTCKNGGCQMTINDSCPSVRKSGGYCIKQTKPLGYNGSWPPASQPNNWGSVLQKRLFYQDPDDIWPSRTGCYNPEERFAFTVDIAKQLLGDAKFPADTLYVPGMYLHERMKGQDAAWVDTDGIQHGVPRDDILMLAPQCREDSLQYNEEMSFGKARTHYQCITRGSEIKVRDSFCDFYVNKPYSYKKYNMEWNDKKQGGCWSREDKPYVDVTQFDHYLPLAYTPFDPQDQTKYDQKTYQGYAHQAGVADDYETYGEYGYAAGRDEALPSNVAALNKVDRHSKAPIVPIHKGDFMTVPLEKVQQGTGGHLSRIYEVFRTAPWYFRSENIYNYKDMILADEVRDLNNMGYKNKRMECLKTFIEEVAHVADCQSVVENHAPAWVNSSHCQWVAFYNAKENTQFKLEDKQPTDHPNRSELFDYMNFVAAGVPPNKNNRAVCEARVTGGDGTRFNMIDAKTLDFSKRGCPDVGGPEINASYFAEVCGKDGEDKDYIWGPNKVGWKRLTDTNMDMLGFKLPFYPVKMLTVDKNSPLSFVTPKFQLPQYRWISRDIRPTDGEPPPPSTPVGGNMRLLPPGGPVYPRDIELVGNWGLSPAWVLTTGGLPIFPQFAQVKAPPVQYPVPMSMGGGWFVFLDKPLLDMKFKELGDKFTLSMLQDAASKLIPGVVDKISNAITKGEGQRDWIDYSFPAQDCGGIDAGFVLAAIKRKDARELTDATNQLAEMFSVDQELINFEKGADGKRKTKFTGDFNPLKGMKIIGGFPCEMGDDGSVQNCMRHSPLSIPWMVIPGSVPMNARWCEFDMYFPFASGKDRLVLMKTPLLSHGLLNTKVDQPDPDRPPQPDADLRDRAMLLTYRVPERIRNGCNAFAQRGSWMYDGAQTGEGLSQFLVGGKGRCEDWSGMFGRQYGDMKITSFRLPRFDYEFMRAFLECTGPIMDKPIPACQFVVDLGDPPPLPFGERFNFAYYTKIAIKSACLAENTARAVTLGTEIYAGAEKLKETIEKIQNEPKPPVDPANKDADGNKKGDGLMVAMQLAPPAIEIITKSIELGKLVTFKKDADLGNIPTVFKVECQQGSRVDKLFKDKGFNLQRLMFNAASAAAYIKAAAKAPAYEPDATAYYSVLAADYALRGDDSTIPRDVLAYSLDEKSDFKTKYPKLTPGRPGFWCKCPKDNPFTTMCREDYCTCEHHIIIGGKPTTTAICADYGPYRRWLQCYYQARAKACPVLEREISPGIAPQQTLQLRTGDSFNSVAGARALKSQQQTFTNGEFKSSNVCEVEDSAAATSGGSGGAAGAGLDTVPGMEGQDRSFFDALSDFIKPTQDTLRWGPGEPNLLAYLPVRNESAGAGFKHPSLVFQSVTRDISAPYMEAAIPFPIELLPNGGESTLFGYEKDLTSYDRPDEKSTGSVFEAQHNDAVRVVASMVPRMESMADEMLQIKYQVFDQGRQFTGQGLVSNYSNLTPPQLNGFSVTSTPSPNNLGANPQAPVSTITDPSPLGKLITGAVTDTDSLSYSHASIPDENIEVMLRALKIQEGSVVNKNLYGFNRYDTEDPYQDPEKQPAMTLAKDILLERYYKGMRAATEAYLYSDKSIPKVIHPKAQDAVVGPRGCDIGGWYEMMLYQARCIKYFGLSCLCDYNKTFINGSAEAFLLQAGGAGITAQRKIGNPNRYVTQDVVYVWPLLDRGVIGPYYAPLSQNAKLIGLDQVKEGDFGITDETIDIVSKTGASDARLRRHGFYVKKVVRSGNLQGNQQSPVALEVMEMNWGKDLDSCGNTDRWNMVTERTIYRSQVVPLPGGIQPLGPCDNPDLTFCYEPNWDRIKIYRTSAETSPAYRVCTKAEVIQPVYDQYKQKEVYPEQDVQNFLKKVVGVCEPPHVPGCLGGTIDKCLEWYNKQ